MRKSGCLHPYLGNGSGFPTFAAAERTDDPKAIVGVGDTAAGIGVETEKEGSGTGQPVVQQPTHKGIG